jgi:hypothetical protein
VRHESSERRSGPQKRQYQLRGTSESDDADGDAQIYPAHQWILKKAENHAAMVAIHFMYYNFGRIHKTLRVTPAMQAGLADHVWSLEEIAELAE